MRINPDLTKSVAFLGVETERGEFMPIGTGFFVTYIQQGFQFVFLATAAHVVENLSDAVRDRLVIRANRKDGAAGLIRPDLRRVFTHDEAENDVMLIAMRIDPAIYDVIAVPGNRAEVEEIRRNAEENTLPGDPVAAIGVYTTHHGKTKNVPVVRTGNVAAVADEPILTGRGYAVAHLIELRTIAGLSGSPVFQTNGPVRIRNGQMQTRLQDASEGTILGVLVGYHCVEDPTDIIAVPRQAARDAGASEQHSADERNTGFGVVIPIERIFEIFERPDVTRGFSNAIQISMAGNAP